MCLGTPLDAAAVPVCFLGAIWGLGALCPGLIGPRCWGCLWLLLLAKPCCSGWLTPWVPSSPAPGSPIAGLVSMVLSHHRDAGSGPVSAVCHSLLCGPVAPQPARPVAQAAAPALSQSSREGTDQQGWMQGQELPPHLPPLICKTVASRERLWAVLSLAQALVWLAGQSWGPTSSRGAFRLPGPCGCCICCLVGGCSNPPQAGRCAGRGLRRADCFWRCHGIYFPEAGSGRARPLACPQAGLPRACLRVLG